MRRQKEAPKNGKPEGNGAKAEPLTDRLEKSNPVRMLIMGGALAGRRLMDSEFIKLLNEGELSNNWSIKYRDAGPVVAAEAVVKCLGTFNLELQITDCSYGRPASEKLKEAGAPEEIIAKVREIEAVLRSRNKRLNGKVAGLDDFEPAPALCVREDVSIRKKDK